MNDFEIIQAHVDRVRTLKEQVELAEKKNFDNITNKSMINENIETAINEGTEIEERYTSINLLYLVSQRRLIKEVIQELSNEKAAILAKRMIDTLPVGMVLEKMASNRNVWIDEAVWKLSRSQDEGCNKLLEEVKGSLSHCKQRLDAMLHLKGTLNLVIGMMETTTNNKNNE
ncbi:hypothetical protein HWI79_2781 [Cryptosporidium felis]|nr:hypothetical protein HWI79_2781 [Cryptosporidium felis]